MSGNVQLIKVISAGVCHVVRMHFGWKFSSDPALWFLVGGKSYDRLMLIDNAC